MNKVFKRSKNKSSPKPSIERKSWVSSAVRLSESTSSQNSNRPDVIVPPPHYQHVYKTAKSSSSLRVKAASHQAMDVVNATQGKNKVYKQKVRRGRRKQRKQQRALRSVQETEAQPRQRSLGETLGNNHFYCDGGSASNPPITPKEKGKKVVVGQVRKEDVHVVQDTKKGVIFRPDPKQLPLFELVPRLENLEETVRDPGPLIDALHNLEEATKRNQSRGGDRNVMHQTPGTKYCCAGVRPNRNGPGIGTSANVEGMETRSWNTVVDYVIRCESLFTKWIDSNVLRAIRHAKDVVKFSSLHRQASCDWAPASIFGSIAFGRNVYLNSHTDQDYTYSIVTVHRPLPDGASNYTVDDDVICYFVFPRYGMAVPLRPGDILIFNPQEYHSVSSRVSNEDDVYCMSLYLKSAVVGLSDNKKPLTEEQQRLADACNNI